MENTKNVLLLGASGSIGSQTLDIINEANGRFVLTAFSVGKNYEKAREILGKFPNIKHVYVISKEDADALRSEYPLVKIYFGKRGLAKLTKAAKFDMCVNALVGFAGLEPSIIALKRNKILCLANKESLVAGGELINALLSKGKGKLYPIDSEHVALAKCLKACKKEDVKRILITASGGALRNLPMEKLEYVKAEEALKHPTWKMGNKITIDCATMMNKGFEIIEAYYLYDFPLEQIEVLMHDESLVHSAVELNDGTFVVDYGKPDMHKPIKWAMYEGEVNNDVIKVKSLSELKDCHFHEYNPKRYPCTELAKQALSDGVSKLVALNAANEVLVNRYLKDEIKFTDIAKKLKEMVDFIPLLPKCSLPMIKLVDKLTRREAENA